MRGQLVEYTLPIAIGELNCSGSEDGLLECPRNSSSCSHHRNDASVVCQILDGNLFIITHCMQRVYRMCMHWHAYSIIIVTKILQCHTQTVLMVN